MPPEIVQPDRRRSHAGHRCVRGESRQSPTRHLLPRHHGRELFENYPMEFCRSPARPAPRRARAATRGTTRRRSAPSASTEPSAVHGRRLPREERLRIEGCGAGREVHLHRARRQSADGSRAAERSARRQLARAGASRPQLADSTCMPGRRRRTRTDPWPSACCSASPTPGFGNIRSSPGSPSRNIDWVLMLAAGGAVHHRAVHRSTPRRAPSSVRSRTCTSPARRSSSSGP